MERSGTQFHNHSTLVDSLKQVDLPVANKKTPSGNLTTRSNLLNRYVIESGLLFSVCCYCQLVRSDVSFLL